MITFYYKCLRGIANAKRYIIYSFFLRIIKGFDIQDTWSLDISLASWMVPRLIHLRDNLHGFPANLNEVKWYEILSKMIYSFEQIAEDKFLMIDNEEMMDKINEGLDLFRQYDFDLWD